MKGSYLLIMMIMTLVVSGGCVQPAAELEDLDKLRSQLAESQAELAEKSERIEALEAKIAELEANLSQLADMPAKLAEKPERIGELESKIAELEVSLSKPALIRDGLYYDPDHINMVKSNLDVEPWASVYEYLRGAAEELLGVKPEPIFGHWHVPDLRKDEEGYLAATKPLRDSSNAMLVCSQLYFFTGEEKFAEKAVEIANAWTGSLMDIDEGEAENCGPREIFLAMATAFDMLQDYKGWSSDEKSAFGCWLNERTSHLIMRSWLRQNLQYWLAAQAAAVGVGTEDREMFDYAVGVYKKAIAYDMAPDGHMPLEAARGYKGLSYHNFAIEPLVFIAEIARKQGLDLWGYTFKGKNLKLAIDYLLYFIDNPNEWPWSQEPQDLTLIKDPCRNGWREMAYYHYRDKRLIKYLQDKRPMPIYDSMCGGLPTLTHGLPIE